jgi:glycerol-3-phosphate acyltransferase PlsY
MRQVRNLPGPAVILAAYVIGSIPFSGLLARKLEGVDLRTVGTGTVSGTGLFRVAGLGPLLVGGILDLAKGSAGPLLAGAHRPTLQVAAGAAGVTGHNWSMFLGGAGGRGISPAMGALTVLAPEGAAVLLTGLAVGRSIRATSLGALGSYLALVPVLSRTRGRRGGLIAVTLIAPLLLKRIAGNRAVRGPQRGRVYLNRLLFDQDESQLPAVRRVRPAGATP